MLWRVEQDSAAVAVTQPPNLLPFVLFILEAPPRFELGMELLQSSALPLGHGAVGFILYHGKFTFVNSCVAYLLEIPS